MESLWSTWILIAFIIFAHQPNSTVSHRIGISYGLKGDNLPSPKDVVELCKRNHIRFIRIYEPVPEVLEALRGSELVVSVGMRNEDISNIAANQELANTWFKTYITPYLNDVFFDFVIVGNEVIPKETMVNDVPKAMNNILNAISSFAPVGLIKVTTTVATEVLGVSYPPSAGAFKEEIVGVMTEVATILNKINGPLMVNVYPYFAYSQNPNEISLDYALFNTEKAVVVDGELKYYNLFDSMVDAVFTALEKINMGNVNILISETGWPTAGNEPYSSVDNARNYNSNLLKHVQQRGTPKRPYLLDTFFFAMFNENLKQAGEEQNFGFFYPNMEPVYPFSWPLLTEWESASTRTSTLQSNSRASICLIIFMYMALYLNS